MTQTIQHRSCVILTKTYTDLTMQKPETEDTKSLLLSVLDSLNNLYEMLNKLSNALQRKNIEQISYPEDKGETR